MISDNDEKSPGNQSATNDKNPSAMMNKSFEEFNKQRKKAIKEKKVHFSDQQVKNQNPPTNGAPSTCRTDKKLEWNQFFPSPPTFVVNKDSSYHSPDWRRVCIGAAAIMASLAGIGLAIYFAPVVIPVLAGLGVYGYLIGCSALLTALGLFITGGCLVNKQCAMPELSPR